MDEERNTPPPVPGEMPPPVPDERPRRQSGSWLDRCCNGLTLIGLLAVIACGGYAIFRDNSQPAPTPEVQTALPEAQPEPEPATPAAGPALDVLAEPAPEPAAPPVADSTGLDSLSFNALDSLANRMRATTDSLSQAAAEQAASDSLHRQRRDTVGRRSVPTRHPNDSLRRRQPARPRPARH